MAGPDGRVALITGAGGGIGRATAQRLAGMGAALVLTDIDAGRLQEAAVLTEKEAPAGPVPVTVPADLTAPEGAAQVVRTALETAGRIDITVCAAGVCTFTGRAELGAERCRRLMEVNYLSMVAIGELVLPVMRSQGRGWFIGITSDLARQPEAHSAAYAASKAAAAAWLKCAALDSAPDGVMVNAVAPGPVNTGMLDGLKDNLRTLYSTAGETVDRETAFGREMSRRQLPIGVLTPGQVAGVITLLLSGDAAPIIGETIGVGGTSRQV